MPGRPEDVILATAKRVKPSLTIPEGETLIQLFDISEGHLLALMKAVDAFHARHGFESDGHLEMHYFDQGDGGMHVELADFDPEYLRVFIPLVPEWVWRGTRLSLVLPGVADV